MKYISTRGEEGGLSFTDSVLAGMARDGGLLLPERIPDVRPRLAAWRSLDYRQLAFEIMGLFADLPPNDLQKLVSTSYASFRDPGIVPVVKAGPVFMLELFHGPTLAFKDVALQFLGNLFEYVLEKRDTSLNIVAATSGDTGSAAIHGVRGKEQMRIFVMHPHGRVSPIQERQMTSVLDSNVFNIAVEGTFDDCQNILKELFNDLAFKDRYRLGAVNSINWSRVLAQVVYYFHGAFRVMELTGAGQVQFAVPTGNFGDIFAGWVAARMGLPVSRLVLATNENDILARFFTTGEYRKGRVQPTLSPSMDIQVASNFERYLYYRTGESPETVRQLMRDFGKKGLLEVQAGQGQQVDRLITAGTCDRRGTLDTIRSYYRDFGYLLDPHTAVGVGVATALPESKDPMICLATAHPAKFPDAIREAVGENVAKHALLDGLDRLPVRCARLPASVEAIRGHIEDIVLQGAA